MTARRRRSRAGTAIVAAGFLTVLVAGLCLGGTWIDPVRAFTALADPLSLDHLRVWELRAPRVAIGALAGAAYALAGTLLQRGLANPLAVPELLGVSAGAAFAVAVLVVGGFAVDPGWTPLLALGGALAGGTLTLRLTAGARDAASMLLVGTAVSSALTAGTVTVASLADRLQLQALLRYLAGGLSELRVGTAVAVAAWTIPVLVIGLAAGPVARILALGDDAAGGLGLPPRAARAGLVGIAALLVAAPTAVTGPIAWIGFLAPAMTRRLFPDASPLREGLLCAATGASAVVLADIAARSAFAPLETPLGVWTAPAVLVVAVVVTLLPALVTAIPGALPRQRPAPGEVR